MPVIEIGGRRFITAEGESFNKQKDIEVEDLRLSRDEDLEHKRRAYRRYDATRQDDAVRLRYKQLSHYTRKKGITFPLTLEEFTELVLATPVEQEETGELTCLSEILQLRDGTVRFHPYEGGLVIKYLDTILVDTSY